METRTKGWTNEAFHRQKGLSIDHGFHDFPAGRRSGSERFYFVFDGELSNESLSTTMSRSYDEESCFFFWGRGRWIDDFSFQTMPVMECIYSLNTAWIWTERNVFLLLRKLPRINERITLLSFNSCKEFVQIKKLNLFKSFRWEFTW